MLRVWDCCLRVWEEDASSVGFRVSGLALEDVFGDRCKTSEGFTQKLCCFREVLEWVE